MSDTPSPGPHDGPTYVPIGDYGFLSDGEVSALVSPGGSIDWMCVPRFDAPSTFGRLLGRHAGSFRVAPSDMRVPAARRYLPGTMILETSWGTESGWIIVRDALLIGPWHHTQDRSSTYVRTPTDYEAEHILLRTIRCVSGEVQTIMDCEPVLDYGREHVVWTYTEQGYHQGVGTAEGTDLELYLTSDMALGFEGGQAEARTLLKAGAIRATWRCPGTGPRRRWTSTTPTSVRCGPRTTGSTGWPEATSRTTPGAATYSAAR